MLRLSNASALWRQIASKNSLQVAGLQLPKFSTEAAKAKEDDDSFELLPPGCSMVDPTYALKE